MGAQPKIAPSLRAERIPTVLREGEQPRYASTTSLAHLQERFGATPPCLEDNLRT